MIDLRSYNTFGVEAFADTLCEITSGAELATIKKNYSDVLILGGGSNVILARNIGCVAVNKIAGIECVSEDDTHVYLKVGGGENWHAFTQQSIDNGWYGLENLSLIPGTVGAAPMQNIGAYGVEVASLIHRVHVYDFKDECVKTLLGSDCGFGYRQSKFKGVWAGRYFVEAVEFKLNKQDNPTIKYGGIADTLKTDRPTARQVANTVIAIRQAKLPDPTQLGNAGSFFKNPIVESEQAQLLKERYESMPQWPNNEKVKLSAAWLIERAGFKGVREGAVGVSDKHSLVIVNYGNASGQDILNFAQKIMTKVHSLFGIQLEIEPVVVD